MLKKIHLNIPLCEDLEHIHVYAKFIKDILSGNCKLKDDENIALAKECSVIILRKLPPKFIDPGRFIIPCSIGLLTISNAFGDLGASINLMSLSMMRKLKYDEPKLTQMTLTLADRSITYPYGILEYVLVRVEDLVFLVDFVILYMSKDFVTPLLIRWPFLEIGKALIDVAIKELIFRFNNENVTFNVFEALKHHQEDS